MAPPIKVKVKAKALPSQRTPATTSSSASTSTPRSDTSPPLIPAFDLADFDIDSLFGGRKGPRRRTWTAEDEERRTTLRLDIDAGIREREEHGDDGLFDEYITSKGKSWSNKWVRTEAVAVARLHLEKRVRGSMEIREGRVDFMDWSELVQLARYVQSINWSKASDAWWAKPRFDTPEFDRAVIKISQDLRSTYGLGDNLDDDVPTDSGDVKRRRSSRREEWKMKDFGGHSPKQNIFEQCALCVGDPDTIDDIPKEIYNATDLLLHHGRYHTAEEARSTFLSHIGDTHDPSIITPAIPKRHLPPFLISTESQSDDHTSGQE